MGKIGVAPSNDVSNIIGNNRDVFPLIHLEEQFIIEFFPQETPKTELGLGVLPFFVHIGKEGDGRDAMPDIRAVKTLLSEFFNNTHLFRMKKKFSTWTNVYSQGNWEEMDLKYWWPLLSPNQRGEDEQGNPKLNDLYY